jgi:hypothetical protein
VPLGITGPEHYLRFCGPCIGASENKNLSAPQKELLKWHWKLGTSMYCVKEMMCERYFEEPNGNKTVLPARIKPKLALARNCIFPPCQSCLLARARKHTPNVLQTHLLGDREGAITRDQYNVGDFVSTDQFICKMPGHLPTGYGRESQDHQLQGGTIFNDAASGLIWVENQVSLGANKTVMGKTRFEQWLYDQCVCEVKHYHGDNGIFIAEEIRCDCEEKQQSQLFYGVGAQHQNAHAERAIQTIIYTAWTFMVHASLHWTERGSDDLSLWSFAVKHSVWIYNCVLNVQSGLTLLELITRERSDYKDILRSHVWGCPVFVLEAKLHKMTKNFPSGIGKLKWANLLVFQTNTLPWWLMYVSCLPISSHHNSMLFLMISSRQSTKLVLMNLSLSLSAKICFNLIGNFMQKKNLTKPVILFTSPLPSMRSGLMKLNDDRVTRIAYNSIVGTMTSCVTAIVLFNRPFLLL